MDVIERQAVIDLVKSRSYDLSEREDEWAMVQDVEELPSAQLIIKVLKLPYTGEPYDMFDALTEEEKQQSKWYAEGYSDALKERKTGKWLKVHGFATPGGDPVWCCSECGKGEHVYGIEYNTYSRNVTEGQWVACPNCGAIMLGEE